MSLDSANCVRKERKQTAGGTYYYVYFFKCTGCCCEISSQHNYLKRHSGKCNSCCRLQEPLRSAYTQLLGNKRRNILVDLSFNQFEQLCKERFCHYCHVLIRRGLGRGYYLDRKDNNLGYTVDNCVPCCWPCNQAKGNRYTYEEFLEISQLVFSMRKKPRIDTRQVFLDLNGFDPY